MYLITRIIGKYLNSKVDQSIERIGVKAQEAIRNPDQVPQKLKDITNDIKPFLSLWTLNKLLSLVILAMATVLGGIIAIQANKLIDNQNKIVQDQNRLFGTQNRYVAQELEKITEQTNFFKKQTDLLDSQLVQMGAQNDLILDQNERIGIQTGLLQDQNYLIGLQQIQTDSQISLLAGQNSRIDTQNYRINIQNNLLEADRRSALIFLMSNILDKVDEEIQVQKQKINKESQINDSTKFSLSNNLINRITALSKALMPYRLLEGDTLSAKLVSPERGQLFIALMQNNFDSLTQKAIVKYSNFSYATVSGIDLRSSFLERAGLSASNIVGIDFRGGSYTGIHFLGSYMQSAFFTDSKLDYSNFDESTISESYFRNADLSNASFKKVHIRLSYFDNSNLRGADFSQAYLSFTTFYGADFSEADLSGTRLYGSSFVDAIFNNANLSNVNFKGAKGLTFLSLSYAKTLYQSEGLDYRIKKALLNTKPCLFKEKGCPNN
ncbi:MAG: pentapeptide repeat-containing protein [Chitinophagales bacterium]|nr:pentapeptide repeat-containing protein [Chitinophagales bacterium]